MKYRSAKLNNIETEFLIWDDPFNCDGNDVILCISGNPGVPDFYEEFGTEIHRRIGLPVCVIGHAGHIKVQDAKSNTLKGQEPLFNLRGQLQHKLELIKLLNEKSKIHLIGHSIGAWMILELLQSDPQLRKRILSINLLFPTLQYMKETKNAFILNKIARNIHRLLLLIVALLPLMPEILRRFLIKVYLKINRLPEHYTTRIERFLCPEVCDKVLFLAYDEMDSVREMNHESVFENRHLINVIYSVKDGWAPLEYFDDLKKLEPDISLSMVKYAHAFVMESSEPVAELAAKFIKTKMT